MESAVVDRELGRVFEALAADVDALFETGVAPADGRDAIVVIGELERLGRRLDAARAELVAAVDRSGVFRDDRHASAKVMVRHVAKMANPTAARRARVAKALRDLPAVAAAWAGGEVGSDQVARIARVHANVRVRRPLIETEAVFVRKALALDYRAFDLWVTGWVSRIDADGTCDQSQATHTNRSAALVQEYNRGWRLRAAGGELDGLEMREVFDRFIDAEFSTDWDKCVAEHGDDACVDKLARTDAQRRFDALAAIFARAGATPPGGTGPSIVTNVVIDWASYQRELVRLAGAQPADPDPTNDDNFRCSSIDGPPLGPTETVAASLLGHVRRVVIGADSVVIDLGRRSRLFRGSAALAARLASTTCYWPGCHVPATHCQIDHLTPYNHQRGSPNGKTSSGGGETNPANGGPACARHNRAKQHGYTAWRDPTGTWHTTRPDGTHIP